MTQENASPESQITGTDDAGFLPSADAPQEVLTSEPPKKRGPGRPRKAESLKPEAPGQPKQSATKPTKRGQKMTQEQQTNLARQLQGLHTMAAMITKNGIFQISDQEAMILATGISAVAEEYGLALDGKTGAAMQLFGACAMVYAPKALALYEMKQQAQRTQNNIVDMPAQ